NQRSCSPINHLETSCCPSRRSANQTQCTITSDCCCGCCCAAGSACLFPDELPFWSPSSPISTSSSPSPSPPSSSSRSSSSLPLLSASRSSLPASDSSSSSSLVDSPLSRPVAFSTP